jgi:uncharacterized protein YidB (DUF937 family)
MSKPLMIGLGALVLGNIVGAVARRDSVTAQPSVPKGGGAGTASPPGGGAGAASPDGGLVGGLGGLLEKLQNAGHGETVKSWLGPGQNQPIEPGQVHSALGQKTVSEAAQQAGMPEKDFLSQLAQHLPEFVDKLTPNGKIPSLQEIAAALSQQK